MKLTFKKPLVPEFIRTEQGLFSIKRLSKQELSEYINLWTKCLKSKYKILTNTKEE